MTQDSGTLLGSCLCDDIHVTAFLCIDHMHLIGTDTGCLFAFTHVSDDVEVDATALAGSDGHAFACVYARALHNGPVHCISASSTYLVASAGHDALPVVQPLANLLTNANDRVSRLHGHTITVTAREFFQLETWVVTCGIRGHFIIFDTTSLASICELRVGFSVRCLVLARDETVCFVGGTGLACIDLYHNDRPLGPLEPQESQSWIKRYSWSPGSSADTVAESSNEEYTNEAPEDLFIARLSVDEDCLTAFFESRDRTVESGAVATWKHDSTNIWLSRDFKRITRARSQQVNTQGRHGPIYRQYDLYKCIKDVMQKGKRGHGSLVLCARYGWDNWRRNYAQVVDRPPAQIVRWSANVCSALPLSSSAYGLLACEEERERRIQAECDAIVQRLMNMPGGTGRKRPRATKTV
uniref:Uncharacterized protein TCIL3000_8_4590 n=1 Tax=Trypanosoma congolense (strain IL3000) TaxID=1068625 RepID=G0US74_TRYCI|nr:unnamed protein product [Trypanosoma congolense IL3000]